MCTDDEMSSREANTNLTFTRSSFYVINDMPLSDGRIFIGGHDRLRTRMRYAMIVNGNRMIDFEWISLNCHHYFPNYVTTVYLHLHDNPNSCHAYNVNFLYFFALIIYRMLLISSCV